MDSLCDSLCDQSTWENLKESLDASQDLLDCVLRELSDRDALPGEQELAIDLEEAIELLKQCCGTVQRNAVEELIWGRTKHPRRLDAGVGSV